MKFPQIFMLLVLLGAIIFSCRETVRKEDNTPTPDYSIPSAEKHRRTRPSPKKIDSIPSENSRESIEKKQKKSKDLDTLKPKVALLE
ncbi:MAG: hypothetical protein KJN85_00110 [Maribacter sp.]|nr:hypothetical protein [Maribacter sp.]MBT8314383.1 hypothetical protein [Maribacter sp.]